MISRTHARFRGSAPFIRVDRAVIDVSRRTQLFNRQTDLHADTSHPAILDYNETASSGVDRLSKLVVAEVFGLSRDVLGKLCCCRDPPGNEHLILCQ